MRFQQSTSSSRFPFSVWRSIAVVVGVLVLICLGWFAWHRQSNPNGVETNTYQLVSLTTGERYVGKLSHLSDDYVVLSDVYYQQADTGQNNNDTITVVRLSSSVAGAENTMHIARDKIVHWENLRSDSKVLKAIRSDAKR